MPLLYRDSYLSSRVDDQLSWLSRASKSNKRVFLTLRIFEIVLGTSITNFSPHAGRVPWGPLAIAMAGGGIALSGGWLALNRNQENWVRYRSLGESLKREKYLFLAGTPPYDVEETVFTNFVVASEALLLDERAGWARQVSQQANADLPGSPPAGSGG
jgi:hypothetical protein